MDDSKKLFTGNFENGTTILPPRITSSRSRGYVAPSRRKAPTTDGDEEERVTNQKKQRYWNSYEEMYIVELWRRYKEEITEFNRPLPVHRKIMVAMRAKDMMVTGQDCRRKLNTLNNRYKTELQRMKTSGVKPDWRLFPIIHCLMEPKIKEFDAWHETKVVKKLLEQLPKPPPEVKPIIPTVASIAPINIRQPLQHQRVPQMNFTPKCSTPLQYIQTYPKVPTQMSDNNVNNYNPPTKLQSSFITSHEKPSSPYPVVKSNLPFRDITLQKYQQIKLTNEILAQQRDVALKRLHLEEESLKVFETILIDWNEQTRKVLKTVESLTKAHELINSQQSSDEEMSSAVLREHSLSVN